MPKVRRNTLMIRAGAGLVFLAAVGASAAQQIGPSTPAALNEISLQRRSLPSYPGTPQGITTAAPEDFSKAQLLPGTLLSMDVAGVPEMSNLSLRISPDGDVSVPTLGSVHLTGFTIDQAQTAIREALIRAELLVSPAVQLNVVQFATGYVSVLGEVQAPGRFPMIGPRSLAEVLALAGGETLSAGSDIEVQRGGSGGEQHIRFTPHEALTTLKSTMVAPGDSVYIARAGVIYVMGAVNKPGGYIMVDGGLLNIFQALSLAGGTTLDAAKNGMYIVRPHDEVFETIKVPFNKLARSPQAQIALRQNDVLFVPRSGLKVTLLDGSAIVGAAVSGATYAAIR